MKVSVTMYGQKTKDDSNTEPAIHPTLYNMSQETIQQLAIEMRKYGVSQLVVSSKVYGAIPATALSMSPLQDDKLPQILMDIRPKLLRALQIYMELYGIKSLGIQLSDDELQELADYWSQLQVNKDQHSDDLKFDNIPLRFDKDPTNEVCAASMAPYLPLR